MYGRPYNEKRRNQPTRLSNREPKNGKGRGCREMALHCGIIDKIKPNAMLRNIHISTKTMAYRVELLTRELVVL
jgi:hypothetical protein